MNDDDRLESADQNLLDALDEVLDLDAGLADATLPSRARTLGEALDTVLDLDAGLTAIVGPGPATGPSLLLDYALDFAHRPAPWRLAARMWFPVGGLADLRIVVVAEATATEVTHAADVVDLDRALDGEAALEPVKVLCERLTRELRPGLRGYLVRHPDATERILTEFTAATSIAAELGLAVPGLAVAAALGESLAHATRFAGRLQGWRGPGDFPADSAAHVAAIRRALAGGQINLAEPHIKHLFRTAPPLLARLLRVAVGRARLTTIAASRDSAFAAAIETADAGELARATPILERALIDVTDADLSDANLSGVPLVGVLWSRATRWPSDLVDGIRARSEQIGPDLWRVTNPDIRLGHTV
ncbi:hypothetical protein [Kutzneria buriramensis]|uniref:Uncharacterized protein n=1 Tax=Kutzneria buriramensis TaxID=1045776 RepID=A0A3E0GYG5_9PSEU|nr:hypothetical protein [Kutzneria buriramensis]REH32590.1 hypothetical protein BCF44_121139 [Kutzneria buriramensis]